MDNPNFSIGYVPEGIVRSGFNDMTDFYLIYREGERKFYFLVRGVKIHLIIDNIDQNPTDRTSYVIEIPVELSTRKTEGQALEQRKRILERMRNYIATDPWIILRYKNISFNG